VRGPFAGAFITLPCCLRIQLRKAIQSGQSISSRGPLLSPWSRSKLLFADVSQRYSENCISPVKMFFQSCGSKTPTVLLNALPLKFSERKRWNFHVPSESFSTISSLEVTVKIHRLLRINMRRFAYLKIVIFEGLFPVIPLPAHESAGLMRYGEKVYFCDDHRRLLPTSQHGLLTHLQNATMSGRFFGNTTVPAFLIWRENIGGKTRSMINSTISVFILTQRFFPHFVCFLRPFGGVSFLTTAPLMAVPVILLWVIDDQTSLRTLERSA